MIAAHSDYLYMYLLPLVVIIPYVCNWLTFYSPCSFASQAFACFAKYLFSTNVININPGVTPKSRGKFQYLYSQIIR
jgi:hypothetical protein